MRWKMACYGGTDVMERSCAVARGKDINKYRYSIDITCTVYPDTIAVQY
jgi:hypothetical protein